MSWLFGNSSAADKAVDAGVDTGDALFYTEEEKAIASQKILDFKIEYARHTQNQSVSRRIITVAVSAMWIMVGICTLAAQFLGLSEFSDYAVKFFTDVVMQPFSIVVAFYFLAHITKSVKV